MKLAAEAVRAALAQPVASAVAALIVAGVCATILSTTGQTVQAEREVLSRIDAAGTRSVVITDAGGAGMSAEAVGRIASMQGVEWVVGLGPATDVRAAGIPGGNPAVLRAFHGDLPPQVAVTGRAPRPGEALVGAQAQRAIGLRHPAGGVAGDRDVAVVGSFTAGEPLAFLDRGLIRPPFAGERELRSVHVLVRSPAEVAGVAEGALSLLGAADRTAVAVETSATLADVRAAVAGELGRFSRNLVALALGAGLLLTALAVYGSVTSRRRDFGRRRALGASRAAIVALVAMQTGAAAVVGAVGGSAVTAVALAGAAGDPPDGRFTVAVVVLAVMAAVLAALPPAVVAAWRDPVRVLRVP